MIDEVAGICPMGCGHTLFLGSGGHVTCSLIGCPRPTAADELLHIPAEHYVTFSEKGWTTEHPVRERLENGMVDCALNEFCRGLENAPMRHGRYIARGAGGGFWSFVVAPPEST